MKSAYVVTLFAAFFAVVVWVGCDDQEPGLCSGCVGPEPGSIQIVMGVFNDTLFFAPGDSASTTVTMIVTDTQGLAMSGQLMEVSVLDTSLGVIEFVDSELRDTTNSLGRVNATYRGFAREGDQIMAASTGSVTAQRVLFIREMP